MLILYWALQMSFSSFCLRNTAEVRKCVCVSPTMEREHGSLGWSHRGRLQRQPSWKWWNRPGTVCFCLRAFCLPQDRTVPHLQSPPPLFQSHHLSPPSPLSPSFSAMQIVSFANVKKQVGGGGWRDEPPAEEGAPIHTPPPPLTPSSRYPPQLIWIN